MIKKLQKKFELLMSFSIKSLTLFFLLLIIFSSSIDVKAEEPIIISIRENSVNLFAEESPILGFSDCMVDEKNPQKGGGAQVITKCFTSISRFVFVVGILVAGYKFAINTLGSYIPGQSIDAVKEGRDAIWGFVVGALLIGAPGVILSLFNSGTLRLDFLSGLTSLGQTNKTGTPAASTSGNNTNTTSSNTGGTGGTGSTGNTNNNTSSNSNTSSTGNAASSSSNVQAQNQYTITSVIKTDPASFAITATDPDNCQYITFEAAPVSSNSTLTKLIGGRFCASTSSPYYYRRLGVNLNIRLDSVNAINQTFTFVVPTGQVINVTSLDQV